MMWSTVAKVRAGKRTGRPHLAQHREGLRARDLVDQVQPDEELRLAARELAHAVRVPDLVEQALPVAGRLPAGLMARKIASPPAALAYAPAHGAAAHRVRPGRRRPLPDDPRAPRLGRERAGSARPGSLSCTAARRSCVCPQGPVAFEIQQGLLGHGWFPIRTGPPARPGGVRARRGAAARLPRRRAAPLSREPAQAGRARLQPGRRDGVRPGAARSRALRRAGGALVVAAAGARGVGRARAPSSRSSRSSSRTAARTRCSPSRWARPRATACSQLGVPATYREYPMGHEVRPELLRDVVEWLESKVLSPIQLV